MKKKHSFFYHIAIFIIAQLAWLLLLGIWIYWYVTNYILFKNVGEKVSSQIKDLKILKKITSKETKSNKKDKDEA